MDFFTIIIPVSTIKKFFGIGGGGGGVGGEGGEFFVTIILILKN